MKLKALFNDMEQEQKIKFNAQELSECYNDSTDSSENFLLQRLDTVQGMQVESQFASSILR